MRLPILAAAAALAISGCASSNVSGSASMGYGGYYDPFYDHYYRDSIYVHQYPNRPTTLPDRPRPPAGMGPGRPTTLPGRVPPRGPR